MTPSAYGQALYVLAREDGLTEAISEDLKRVWGLFTQFPAYPMLLSLAGLSPAERCGLLDRAFSGRVHPYVLNLLKLLTQRGQIGRFPGCYQDYLRRFREETGLLPVTALTASPLSPETRLRLQQKLERLTGKPVDLENRVEPEVLASVCLLFPDKRLDGTLRTRLDRWKTGAEQALISPIEG